MATPEPPDGEEMSFVSHLVELRSRLLKCVATVLLVLLALIPFANRLYALLAEPLVSHLPSGGTMIATEVASPFLTPLKLAFFVALFAAMPVILYQLWAFVAPGLYRHEKRLATPILVSSVILFYVGCAFAYFFVLPAVFAFTTQPTVAARLTLAHGVVPRLCPAPGGETEPPAFLLERLAGSGLVSDGAAVVLLASTAEPATGPNVLGVHRVPAGRKPD